MTKGILAVVFDAQRFITEARNNVDDRFCCLGNNDKMHYRFYRLSGNSSTICGTETPG